MCGVCGIIDFKSKVIQKDILKKMCSELKHRGPDDEGMFIYKNVGFGHVRLSIIDLSSSGHLQCLAQMDATVLFIMGKSTTIESLDYNLSINIVFQVRPTPKLFLILTSSGGLPVWKNSTACLPLLFMTQI